MVDAAYLPRLFEKYNRTLNNRVSLTAIDTLPGSKLRQSFVSGILPQGFSRECRILMLSKIRVDMALDPNFTVGTGINPWYKHRYTIDNYQDRF